MKIGEATQSKLAVLQLLCELYLFHLQVRWNKLAFPFPPFSHLLIGVFSCFSEMFQSWVARFLIPLPLQQSSIDPTRGTWTGYLSLGIRFCCNGEGNGVRT